MVTVTALPNFPSHIKAYAGVAGVGNTTTLCTRIDNHLNPSHRQVAPSELHTAMDMPDSQTKFVTLAIHPKTAHPGELLMGEDVLTGALGLHESRTLYQQLAAVQVPVCQNGLRVPSLGLNGELSLRYGLHSDSHANIDRRNHARALMALVTTGRVVGWDTTVAFDLFKQQQVFIPEHYSKRHPELKTVNTAIVAISITPNCHPYPYLQWNSGQLTPDDSPAELRRFGIWSQLPNCGFWLIARKILYRRPSYEETNREKAYDVAFAVTEGYGLNEQPEE